MKNIDFYIISVFAAVNVLSFLLCFYDKAVSKFKNVNLRISERTLFLSSAFFGGLGMYLAMRLFRHKTQHRKFMIFTPLFAAAQIILLFFALRYINT